MGSIVAKAGSTVAVVTFFDISTVNVVITFMNATLKEVLPFIVSCRYPLYHLCPGCHGLCPLFLRSGVGKLCHLHGAVVDRSFNDNWHRPHLGKEGNKSETKTTCRHNSVGTPHTTVDRSKMDKRSIQMHAQHEMHIA